MNNVLIQNWR